MSIDGRYRRLADRSVCWTATEAIETAISVYLTRAVIEEGCKTAWTGIDAALLDESQVGQHQEKRLSMKKKMSTKLYEAMNSHCSALMSRLGHRSWRSPVWLELVVDVLYLEPQATVMRRGTMSPWLIGVPRTTDHLSRRRILRCFWDQKFLEEKVVTILPRIPSWSAKPFSLGKVTHLTRIQFAIKVENLWKNPITCSGNTFEEGTPFQRIRYRKWETHGVKVSH